MLDEVASRPFIKQALELGINFFDTADMYSLGVGEEVMGRALRDFARRDEVVLATKVFYPMSDLPNDRGLSRKHILASIDASLKRLGTDYVDLSIAHRFDPTTPIDETLEAFDTVVRSGKACYIGASSIYAWQFMAMLARQRELGLARFVSSSNHPIGRARWPATIEIERRLHSTPRRDGPGQACGVRSRIVASITRPC
ncbi:aldo/keto reductase [Rhodocyclus purpureus]|uniref:aldo/keto reductase n=1 Tax=Rhodocyclus purpureus TaxID=1067 RepID=UPI00308456F3